MLYQTTDFDKNLNIIFLAGTRVFCDGSRKQVELAFIRGVPDPNKGAPEYFDQTTLADAFRKTHGGLGLASNWSAPHSDHWFFYKGRREEKAYVLRQSFLARETPEDENPIRFWVYTTFDTDTDASETFIFNNFNAGKPEEADWYFEKVCKASHEVVISSLTPCTVDPFSNVPPGFDQCPRPAKG